LLFSSEDLAVLMGCCSRKPIDTGQATSALRLHSRPL